MLWGWPAPGSCHKRKGNTRARAVVARYGPVVAIFEPMVRVGLERVEALELLGMVIAHLNHAEASGDLSPRIPTLMAIRDKLATGLREEQ